MKETKITFRTMKFDFYDKGFPRYWHSDSASITFFFNALSSAFPPGEKFFCDSVVYFKNHLQDEELKKQIDLFVKQEMHHAFYHKKFNKMLESMGFDMKKAEQRNADFLNFARKNYNPMEQLALTLAFEHFTAALAFELLEKDDFKNRAHKSVGELWLWHAAEELEHKSIAMEVFLKMNGRYRTRLRVYLVAFYYLFSIAFKNQFDMLKCDGRLTLKEYMITFWYLFGPRGLLVGVLKSLFTFLRPGFNPQDHDTSYLHKKWEEENQSQIVGRAS